MSHIEELLRSMTWDEKLAQMQVVFRPDPAEVERWARAGVGAIFWPRSALAVNALQRVAVEQTRLGIPLLVGLDVIHGHEKTGRPATAGGTMRQEAVDIGLAGPDNVTEKYTSKYLDLELGPQFEFGHGGGYTTFRHANARLSAGRLSPEALERGEHVLVSIDVSNTGDRDGDEVVQLYVQDLVASVAQPVRRLVGFARRRVAVGQTITVSFRLGMEQLGFWDAEPRPARFVVEPGAFSLFIGGSLQATRELTFEVS